MYNTLPGTCWQCGWTLECRCTACEEPAPSEAEKLAKLIYLYISIDTGGDLSEKLVVRSMWSFFINILFLM